MKKGFTLIELIITITVIGTIAAIAIPQYVKIRKNNLDKPAKVMLNLIRVAQANYKMEYGDYYTCTGSVCTPTSNITDINSHLKIKLPLTPWIFVIGLNDATYAIAEHPGRGCTISFNQATNDNVTCFNSGTFPSQL